MKKSREQIFEEKLVFLKALSECGTIRESCLATGISRRTYERWVANDPVFSKDVDTRRIVFSEYLEDIAHYRVKNPEKGIGTDMLLWNLLTANNPGKYRTAVTVTGEAAKDLLAEWRQSQKEQRREVPVEGGKDELPEIISREKDLVEIMEKRGNSPEESEESEE